MNPKLYFVALTRSLSMTEPLQPAKIAILINPVSGNGRSVKTGQLLSRRLDVLGRSYECFELHWPGSLEGFSEIWIIGGDGTYNYFLNHYPANQLPLAFFKGGTGNDIHWKLYGDIETEQQLEFVLNTEARPVDAAMCNDKIFINSAGLGFDGEVLQSMGTIRWLGGHLGYLWIVIRKIFSFKEYGFVVKYGQTTLREKFLLVAVNNSSRTGGGFLVTPLASLTDGKLDLLLCRKLPVLKRLKYLPVIEKGRHLDLPFIIFSQESSVTIEAEKEIFAQLDGELISGRSFVFTSLPGFLLVKH